MGLNNTDIRIGEFLVENEMITEAELNDALDMQKDNPGRVIGEILVTMGLLSKEELIMALEVYMMLKDIVLDHIDEWLDQEEVDMLMERKERRKNN